VVSGLAGEVSREIGARRLLVGDFAVYMTTDEFLEIWNVIYDFSGVLIFFDSMHAYGIFWKFFPGQYQ
jgi:hypothetical protein